LPRFEAFPILAWAAISAFLLACQTAAQPIPPSYRDIGPILAEHCVVCHSGNNAPNGLRLDSYDNLTNGSETGPVARAGNPADSEIIRRLRGTSLPRMPLTGPPYLDEATIQKFEAWITAGLPAGPDPTLAAAPIPRRPAAGEPVTFADVQPILLARCAKCHKDDGKMGTPPEGLRLDTLQRVLAGGERLVVLPRNPRASELWRRVQGISHPRMPFDGPPFLTDDDIRLIRDWIAQGAPDQKGVPAPIPTGASIRLRGILDTPRSVDGVPFRLAPYTRIDRAPQVGSAVELRAIVNDDGTLVAERLRRR
jgi:mono/diheme cytochrome c family protein